MAEDDLFDFSLLAALAVIVLVGVQLVWASLEYELAAERAAVFRDHHPPPSLARPLRPPVIR